MDHERRYAAWDHTIRQFKRVGDLAELNPQHAQGIWCKNADVVLSAQLGIEAAEGGTNKN